MKEEKVSDWKKKREEIIKSLLGWIIPVLGIVFSLIILSSILPLLTAAWKSVVPASGSHNIPEKSRDEVPANRNWVLTRTFQKIWDGDKKFRLERPDESVGLLLRLDGKKLVLFPALSRGEVYDLATNMIPQIKYNTSVEARIFDENYTNPIVRVTVIPRGD